MEMTTEVSYNVYRLQFKNIEVRELYVFFLDLFPGEVQNLKSTMDTSTCRFSVLGVGQTNKL